MTTKKFNELIDEFVAKVNDSFATDYTRSETDHFYDVNCNESFVTTHVLSYLPSSLFKILSIDVDANNHVVLTFAKGDLS